MLYFQGYDHHVGPYCSGCAEGYVMVDGRCESCDTISGTNRSMTVVIVGLVVFAAFLLAYKQSDRARGVIGKLNTRSMITKLKVK